MPSRRPSQLTTNPLSSMPTVRNNSNSKRSPQSARKRERQRILIFFTMTFLILIIIIIVIAVTQSTPNSSPNSYTQLSAQSLQKIPQTTAPQLLNTYPHDSMAFTQGLAFSNNGQMYESTGLYGKSSVRIVDLLTGNVLKSVALPNNVFGEGLTIANSRIYVLTWRENIGYIYDLNLNKLSEFSYNHEGWGLTSNNEHLIASDGSSNLYFYDISDQPKLVKTLQVTTLNSGNRQPVTNLNELEWIEGLIYANVWYTQFIVVIDPTSGYVVKAIDVSALKGDSNNPEAVPNGIARNPVDEKIYVTGKLWDKLYEITIR